MALTQDATIDFDPGNGGYSFNPAEVELDGSGARLVAGFTGTSTMLTENVDTSAYGDLHKVTGTIIEADGYYYQFLISQDNGLNWKTWDTAGWSNVKLSEITTRGMTKTDLLQAREWFDPTETGQLRFAIAITRAAGGSTGNIAALILWHGDTSEDLAIADPDPFDVLSDRPVFPVHGEMVESFAEQRAGNGYQDRKRTGTKIRSRYDLLWVTKTLAERDAILAFLNAHLSVSFHWTPPEEDAPVRFKSSEPQHEHIDLLNCWQVTAKLTQTFEGEG